MKDTQGAAWNFIASIIGAAVFFTVIWVAAKLNSRMWRQVAARYGKQSQAPTITRKIPETIVIARRTSAPIPMSSADYRRYVGVCIFIHEHGLSLSILPPLNPVCPSIDLPFDEMELRPTFWALWPEPQAIRMRKLDGIDIILGRDTIRWLREHIDHPPFGWDS